MLFSLYEPSLLLLSAGGSKILILGGVPCLTPPQMRPGSLVRVFLSLSRLGLERRKPTRIMVGGG